MPLMLPCVVLKPGQLLVGQAATHRPFPILNYPSLGVPEIFRRELAALDQGSSPVAEHVFLIYEAVVRC